MIAMDAIVREMVDLDFSINNSQGYVNIQNVHPQVVLSRSNSKFLRNVTILSTNISKLSHNEWPVLYIPHLLTASSQLMILFMYYSFNDPLPLLMQVKI